MCVVHFSCKRVLGRPDTGQLLCTRRLERSRWHQQCRWRFGSCRPEDSRSTFRWRGIRLWFPCGQSRWTGRPGLHTPNYSWPDPGGKLKVLKIERVFWTEWGAVSYGRFGFDNGNWGRSVGRYRGSDDDWSCAGNRKWCQTRKSVERLRGDHRSWQWKWRKRWRCWWWRRWRGGSGRQRSRFSTQIFIHRTTGPNETTVKDWRFYQTCSLCQSNAVTPEDHDVRRRLVHAV